MPACMGAVRRAGEGEGGGKGDGRQRREPRAPEFVRIPPRPRRLDAFYVRRGVMHRPAYENSLGSPDWRNTTACCTRHDVRRYISQVQFPTVQSISDRNANSFACYIMTFFLSESFAPQVDIYVTPFCPSFIVS